jgi:transposase
LNKKIANTFVEVANKYLTINENKLDKECYDLISSMAVFLKDSISEVKANSSNSGVPPSQDQNRDRGSKKEKTGKSPGGQKGHKGNCLTKVSNPDKIIDIPVDLSTLPNGEYKETGFEERQIINYKIIREVVEYRAQIVSDEYGRLYTANFPEFITKAVQYGNSLKSHAVYLSQFQLIPYLRLKEHFTYNFDISLGTGSIYNFNKEAFNRLEDFEKWVRGQAENALVLHVDETGINVNTEKYWVHTYAGVSFTYMVPHKNRGLEAVNSIGILKKFKEYLIHDGWSTYYRYDCSHIRCNAHHLRELTAVVENDGYKWASLMNSLLCEINDEANKAGGFLLEVRVKDYKSQYNLIIAQGEVECPVPKKTNPPKKGRVAKGKARNLLERFKNRAEEILIFMEIKDVPFTNNCAELAHRMLKVHQKISGCFKGITGAKIACRIRSYIDTCRKNNVPAI